MATKSYEIRRGRRTEIDVPHAGDVTTFIHPRFGPGTYAQVQGAIEQAGLIPATMAELSSLVYAAFQDPENKEAEFTDIKDTMKNRYLRGSTGLLWFPQE